MEDGKGNIGLVLEGGGMRGMFTCGVLDVMMREGLDRHIGGMVGVSAGATFGCNIKSRQIGRALRYNQRFAADARYMGLRSWLSTGSILHPEFAYHTVPTQLDVFDAETFERNPMDFHLVCTDVLTAKPVYHRVREVNYEELEWIRATSSLPVVSRPVELEGRKLLDGGLSDSIPLQYFQQQGYERNVVVLTQPRGFRKKASRVSRLWHLLLPRYPRVARLLRNRPERYNAQLDYLQAQELLGNTLVICPSQPIRISRLESNPALLQQAYDLGIREAKRMLPQLKHFLQA